MNGASSSAMQKIKDNKKFKPDYRYCFDRLIENVLKIGAEWDFALLIEYISEEMHLCSFLRA